MSTTKRLTKEERAFLKQFNGASLDEDELADVASEVPGPLGDAAKALAAARARFDLELERIGYENG